MMAIGHPPLLRIELDSCSPLEYVLVALLLDGLALDQSGLPYQSHFGLVSPVDSVFFSLSVGSVVSWMDTDSMRIGSLPTPYYFLPLGLLREDTSQNGGDGQFFSV